MSANFNLESFCQAARHASLQLAKTTTQEKDLALGLMAQKLHQNQQDILNANNQDMQAAQKNRLAASLMDRLLLTQERIEQMAQGLEDIQKLTDPVGQIVETKKRPNGLVIEKVRIPIGVISIIYESRPNVTADAAGLCLKSGNAIILRGGSEAQHSNREIAKILSQALKEAKLDPKCIQILPSQDRHLVEDLLKMDQYIDLMIPRGGETLIEFVVENSKIPVLKHYKGVCHLYLDESAQEEMALNITINAKTQRPGVCNAIETLLVHQGLKTTILPKLLKSLIDLGVDVRGSKELQQINSQVTSIQESDWGEEFLDLILPIKLVQGIDEALEHILKYGSNHTEAIVTENKAHAERFVRELPSSCIAVNTSTRFADGGQMGMGAEMGISTTRLHAYGPMGVEDLTIGRYVIRGQGQIRE